MSPSARTSKGFLIVETRVASSRRHFKNTISRIRRFAELQLDLGQAIPELRLLRCKRVLIDLLGECVQVPMLVIGVDRLD
jgi:hypothetical protein